MRRKLTRIVSWNVNGLRAVISKGRLGDVEESAPDFLCMQETKAAREQVGSVLPAYPHQFFAEAEKKGYSGTAVFCKAEPLDVRYGMGKKDHDREGRLITVELPGFYLVNVYTPNAQRGLSRLDYRKRWDRAFLTYLKSLDKRKPVVFCGDLNVAHEEIDLANPGSNHKNAGFTDEERAGFSRMLSQGFMDSFRELHPGEGGHYSWWSQLQKTARANNVGWRIDYVGMSKRLRPFLREAFIWSQIMGSDHCPVGVILEEPAG